MIERFETGTLSKRDAILDGSDLTLIESRPRMVEHRDRVFTQTEIAEAILDIPSRGQCFISLDDQIFLLSIYASGEEDVCKLSVQDPGPIKVDNFGPVEPYNQLIYRASVIRDTHIGLVEKHGYPDIKNGEEIDFLGRLLLEGESTWIQK